MDERRSDAEPSRVGRIMESLHSRSPRGNLPKVSQVAAAWPERPRRVACGERAMRTCPRHARRCLMSTSNERMVEPAESRRVTLGREVEAQPAHCQETPRDTGRAGVRFRGVKGEWVESAAPAEVATIRIADRSTLLGLVRSPDVEFGDGYSEARIEVDGDLVDVRSAPSRCDAWRVETLAAEPGTAQHARPLTRQRPRPLRHRQCVAHSLDPLQSAVARMQSGWRSSARNRSR